MSPRYKRLLYFLAAFLPAWLAKGTEIMGSGRTPQGFLEWSLLVVFSLIPGITALLASFDSSTATTTAHK